jgi:predicted ferric reductase
MKSKSYSFQRLTWYVVYGLGIAAILWFWWTITGRTASANTYGFDLAVGHITGLIGTYCILWELVLLSRLVFLERAFGMELLTWLHKWNGYAALILLLLHTLYLTLGYALVDRTGIIAQFVDFNLNWEDVLKASIGMLLLIAIVFISIGIVRMRMKYETWYYVHLFTYLAILLAFSHQLSVGADFVGQPTFQAFWWALNVLAVGVIVVYRFLRPLYLVYHHQPRVDRIVAETSDVTSIYIKGRHLDELHYQPGQFMIWRFLTPELWWQAHPFSLSVAPNGKYLRMTVKQVGDFTRLLPNLRPGTLVSMDGPHGNFTPERISRPQVLLIAGGVGITPIRSMLEQLPDGVTDVAMVYAARTQADLALRTELEALMKRYDGTVRYILSAETVPGMASGVLDDAHLRQLVPDAAKREVMLCGPPMMMNAVTDVLVGQGLSRDRIHTERFAY